MISFKETLGYGQVSEIHNATFTDFHMLYIETEKAVGVAEVSWNASFASDKERNS